MPARTPATKLPRQIQIFAGQGAAQDINASVMLAIQALQGQLAALQQSVGTALTGQSGAGAGTSTGTTPYSTINTTTPTLTNKSGSARQNGDVVVKYTGATESFTTTTTEGDPNVLGAVYSDSPDKVAPAIDINAEGMICCEGIAGVRADGNGAAISVGDYLIASTTEGVAIKAASRFDEGVFAMALEPLVDAADVIICYIGRFPKSNFIKWESVTPSNPSTCVISSAPATSASMMTPQLIVIDNDTGQLGFPSNIDDFHAGRGGYSHIGAAGATLTNYNADWNVGSGNISVIYLPQENWTQENEFLFQSIIQAFFDMYVPPAAHPRDYYRVSIFDTDGTGGALSGYIASYTTYNDISLSFVLDHKIFHYSGEYIVSTIMSNVTTGKLIEKAFLYTGDQIDRIIQEVQSL